MEIITFHYSYMKNSLCNLCNIVEDYSHYIRTCIFFKEFWGKIKESLKKSGIENDITLYHLVFGHNIFDISYCHTAIENLSDPIGYLLDFTNPYYTALAGNMKARAKKDNSF